MTNQERIDLLPEPYRKVFKDGEVLSMPSIINRHMSFYDAIMSINWDTIDRHHFGNRTGGNLYNLLKNHELINQL